MVHFYFYWQYWNKCKKNFKFVTTESSQNHDFMRKHPSEGMDALEKESKLPLKGWENEVARAKEYGLEAA